MEIAENIDIIGYEWLGEEDGSVMMAAEDSWRGLAVELNELHFVKGVPSRRMIIIELNIKELTRLWLNIS